MQYKLNVSQGQQMCIAKPRVVGLYVFSMNCIFVAIVSGLVLKHVDLRCGNSLRYGKESVRVYVATLLLVAFAFLGNW